MTVKDNDFTNARTNRVRAAVLGAFVTLIGMTLAIVTGLAIDRLSAKRVALGLAMLAGVVVARWLVAEALDTWFARAARRQRSLWRSVVLEFFFVPPPNASPSPVEIARAIDDVVDEPRLEVVKASAQVSILALPIVWWSGGWQALGIVVVLLAVAAPVYRRAGMRAAELESEYRERRVRLSERQLELLAHAPELRALGAVEYARDEIGALSDSEHQVALLAIRTALGSSLVTEFLGGVSVGLVAMDVGVGLLNGRLSLLRALIAVLVTSEFFSHVRRFGVEFHRREAVEAAARRLVTPVPIDSGASDVLQAFGLVTHVHPEEITFALNRGERVAVLGASGIGKTTLAHTLLGWRAPRRGRVERSTEPIAYVSADTSLLEGTLGDNLRLGLTISDDVVRQQLSALGLDGPRFERLDGLVAADGEGFSSGERVRVLIARALLHGPVLLILDDVAGLLDEEACEALRRQLNSRRDIAVIEISVDEAVLIDATSKVRLS